MTTTADQEVVTHPPRPPQHWLGRHADLCTAVVAFCLLIPFLVKLPINIDIGLHTAVIEHWRHDLLHPSNPLMNEPGPSPYYSPYTLVWVLVAVVFHLSTFTVLKLAATVNVIVLLAALRMFVRYFSSAPLAYPLSLLAITVVWGSESLLWSGFLPLGSLVVTMPFPSFFGTGLALIIITRVLRAQTRAFSWPGTWLTVVLFAVLLLVHQATAGGAAVAVLAVVLGRAVSGRSLRPVLVYGAAVLLAVALATAWPWYSILELIFTTGLSGRMDAAHTYIYNSFDHLPHYHYWGIRYGLLPLTLPALVLRFRRRRTDELVWMSLFPFALVCLGFFTQHWTMGRFLPWAALPAQIALAVAVSEWRAHRPEPRFRVFTRVSALVGVVALVLGSLTQVGLARTYAPDSVTSALPAVFERPYQLYAHYDWAAKHMKYGDVIMTNSYTALLFAPAYGQFTVEPAYTDPFLSQEESRRRKDTDTFFAPETSGRVRLHLLHEYHVAWVIADPQVAVPHRIEGADGKSVVLTRIAQSPYGPEDNPKGFREILYKVTQRP